MALFGKKNNDKDEAPSMVDAALPPHTALRPHWDSAADMGHEEKAVSFTCEACQQTFTPEEAQQLRSTESERLQAQSEAVIQDAAAPPA